MNNRQGTSPGYYYAITEHTLAIPGGVTLWLASSRDANCGVAITIAAMGAAGMVQMKLMDTLAPETFGRLGRVVWGGDGQYWILDAGFTASELGGGGGGS